MKRYIGYVQTNRVGSKCSFEFEMEDDATPEEIEEEAREAMWDSGQVEWWYEEVEDDED